MSAAPSLGFNVEQKPVLSDGRISKLVDAFRWRSQIELAEELSMEIWQPGP